MTLPASVRKKYGLRDGNTVALVDLDGAFLIVPRALTMPRLAKELERHRKKRALTLKDLGGPSRED